MGWRRTIRKDMSEMPTAPGTTDFRPQHAVTSILDLQNIFAGKGFKEAGPSGA